MRSNFLGLNNGIRLFRSSLTLKNSDFDAILADAGSVPAHHGHAIWGIDFGTATLNLDGGGSQVIRASDHGIHLKNMNAIINKTGIQASTGITLVNCKMKQVSITNQLTAASALDCQHYALKSSNCQPLKAGSIIKDNFIRMSNPGNTSPVGSGILLGEGANVTTPGTVGWNIQHNFLDLDRTYWGIRGVGVHKAEFRDNDIEFLNGSLPRVIGVDVLNANKMLANCNDVHTTATGFDPKGYLFKNVSQSNYICNTADAMTTGMEFSVLCEGTTLKGSEFDNTPTGLRLKNDVTLGTQGLDQMNLLFEDHGNRWAVSAAEHEATNPILVEMSRFGVDPAENAEFNPSSNWGNIWFWSEPTPTVPSFYCAGFQCTSMQEYLKDRDVEKAVANGSIDTVGLPGVMPKILENHLYAVLQQNPAWAAGDTIYAQFLQSKYGTTTAAFWQIQQGIDALNNRTASEQNAISAIEDNISDLRHDLYIMDSTYASGTAINAAHYTVKLGMLSSAVDTLQTQLDNLRSARLTQAAQLLIQNAAIGTTQTWEQNEKLVNELEIRIFVQDSVNTPQLALLDGIGMLCPNTNGEAVLRAQVLYNRFVEKEFSPVCTGARCGAGERGEESLSTATLKVYPNPTTGLVNIPNPKAVTRSVQVFDIAGRLVHQVTTSEIEIDLGDLKNGVYFLRIMDESTGITGSAKFIISK